MAISDMDIRKWAPRDEVGVHRFTREEYARMVFDPDRRVELLDGVIFDMSPQSGNHAKGVAKAVQALMAALSPASAPDAPVASVARYHVRPQLPLALFADSMPEPDIAVIAGDPDDYDDHPSRAVLVLEVADTSQHHDRKRKARIYARAGIADYWIVNLRLDLVEVLRDPLNGWYRTRITAARGETVSPQARPEAAIAVDDLLPRSPAA